MVPVHPEKHGFVVQSLCCKTWVEGVEGSMYRRMICSAQEQKSEWKIGWIRGRMNDRMTEWIDDRQRPVLTLRFAFDQCEYLISRPPCAV